MTGYESDPNSKTPGLDIGKYTGNQFTGSALGTNPTEGVWSHYGQGWKDFTNLPDTQRWFFTNRKDPNLQHNTLQKFMTYLQDNGDLPAFFQEGADISSFSTEDWESLAPHIPNMWPVIQKAVSSGDYTPLTDIISNIRKGFQQELAANSGKFRSQIRGPVLTRHISDKATGLWEFFKNLISSIGGGVGNIGQYLMELLGQVSPGFKTMWDNIQGHRDAVDNLAADNAQTNEPDGDS